MTHYELLQISETASPEVIRAAYMALAKKHHPDFNRDNLAQAEEKMKQINAAYETLSDPIKRRNYDLQLRIQRTRQSTYQSNTSQYSQYQSNTNENSQDQSHHQTYTRPQSDTQPPKKEPKKKKITKWLLSVLYIAFAISLVAVPLYIYYYSADNTSSASESPSSNNQTTTSAQSTLTPVSQPISGTILEGYERHNASEITVTASHSEACVVKLKNLWGDTVLSFYVRAGQTATVGVPAQKLYVYFASGKTWYGKEKLFGSSTSYSKDDGSLDFENYTWSYTLYPVTDGNFTETPIDADEFFD